MSVPQELLELVERFNTNREAYRSGQYNEAQLRREFIDPFFQLLGWDVNNEKGYAEAYKDVIHEDSIKVGGVTKAPDYCFRIGGVRKFFVETKKPSVNLKDDISPAFQLRRYAWSAKLPLSILTDFEEFVVYDCRVKPNKTDKASTARIMYMSDCAEYAQRWDEIASIFSREAVLKGSFDRYAESSKAKKGTAEVDTAFLKEIESWRDVLARNLALRNPDLSQHDLNFAVQRTIDRIIFLRICEDRGIEHYGKLMALQNGDRVYERLCELFYRADERYNSGLFHFQKEKDRSESPDKLTPNLAIDDGALRDIIKNLYYPDSPYEFSVLSADILGQVYEQFLGKVIRLTEGHRAVVEEKPEVRKAGGVYYTPTYIVDYIVKNTVGQLVKSEVHNRSTERSRRSLKSKIKCVTPKEISKIRILDPACGSGSFLLGAYQYLLDWHRDWYVADGIEKWATGKTPALYQATSLNPTPAVDAKHENSHHKVAEGTKEGNLSLRALRLCGESNPKSTTGEWHLTTAERKRILLNNIYGVDIDPQAVEVTKLSLLLKVLEDESEQTLAKQLKMFHERALPDLGNNIKCGNSLIGPNFYEGGQMSLFDNEERYRINVFDWEREFPEIMKNGGFDAVIGNPPYGASLSQEETTYLLTNFKLQNYKLDSYLLFIEKSLILLRKDGLIGMIIPNTWLLNLQSKEIRRHIFNRTEIENIVHYRRPVFKATVDTEITILKKGNPASTHLIKIIVIDKDDSRITYSVAQQRWKAANGNPVNLFERPEFVTFSDKLKAFPLLDNICVITQGAKPFQVGKGKPPQTRKIVDEKPFVSEKKQNSTFRPLLRGSIIQKYAILWNNDYWISFGDWLAEPRYSANYDASVKIVIRQTGDSLIATLDCHQFIARDNLYTIISHNNTFDLRYILGLLNSRLLTWIYQNIINPEKGEALAQVKRGHLAQLPIAILNISNPADKARHDQMVELVDQMLGLHKQLASAKTDHDKTVIQRQIDATDRQIDLLVYELYGLTEEEIKIVEECSP